MSDEYFEQAQRKIIVGGDPYSDGVISVAKDIYDEAQALKPGRDDLGRLAVNLSATLSSRSTQREFAEALCEAWNYTFSKLELVGATEENVYVTGVCKDTGLFLDTFKMFSPLNGGVKFVDMKEDI